LTVFLLCFFQFLVWEAELPQQDEVVPPRVDFVPTVRPTGVLEETLETEFL
jgi:hypothetical protein